MIEIGQVLNDTYRIDSEIGHGGGGLIYKAYHIRMRKYVAIKLIRDRVKNVVDVRAEVDILKNLKHPNLPMVMDYIDDGEGNIYTVMEYIDGDNFAQILSNGTGITEKIVVQYMMELCDAVIYLHTRKPVIIHSDIKPANIMRTRDGHICLIDFNISTIGNLGDKSAAISYGGSQGFGAPEQFKKIVSAPDKIEDFHEETRFIDSDETEIIRPGTDLKPKAYVDVRTDVYGLGATMYYMLTRRVPAGGKVNIKGKGVSKELLRIIEKATDPDPSRRYSDADAMKADLMKCASSARDVVPNFTAINDKSSRIPAIAAASAVVVIIAVIIVINKNDTGDIASVNDTSATTTVISLSETETTVTSAESEVSAVETLPTEASSEVTTESTTKTTTTQTTTEQTTTDTTTTPVTTSETTTAPETTMQETTTTTAPTTTVQTTTTVPTTTEQTTTTVKTTVQAKTTATTKETVQTTTAATTKNSNIDNYYELKFDKEFFSDTPGWLWVNYDEKKFKKDISRITYDMYVMDDKDKDKISYTYTENEKLTEVYDDDGWLTYKSCYRVDPTGFVISIPALNYSNKELRLRFVLHIDYKSPAEKGYKGKELVYDYDCTVDSAGNTYIDGICIN